MVDASPEAPLARTPENYRELQAMIHYADPLFIGRNGAWIGSQAVLLAITVAQFDRVPTAMGADPRGDRRDHFALLAPQRPRREPASPGSTTRSASTRDPSTRGTSPIAGPPSPGASPSTS